MIYCKHCGRELEKGMCFCGANFNDEKSTSIKQIKCDTCKKTIDADSKYCPYCGIPVGTEIYNDILKKELKGEFAEDVLAYMKTNEKNKRNNGAIQTLKVKKFVVAGVVILLLLFVVKGIMIIKDNLSKQQEQKQQQEELLMDIANTANETVETKTYYNVRNEEQKIIPIRDNWVRRNGYFYCLDDNGNEILDDWVEEKDDEGNVIYYYFDIDGKLVVNSWIDDKYYIGEDGIMYAEKMTPDGIFVDKNGDIVKEKSETTLLPQPELKVYYEMPSVDSIEKPVNQTSSSSGSFKGVDAEKTYELYIEDIKKIMEVKKENDEHYRATYYYPVINGAQEKEIKKVNDLIFDMFNNKFKDILFNIKDEQGNMPKSIILNLVEQTQVNQNRFIFIVSGRLVSRKGFIEKKKFRFVYDRKSKKLDLLDISEY